MSGELQGMGLDFSGWDLGGYSGDPQAGQAVGVPSVVGREGFMPGDFDDAMHMDAFTTAPAEQQGAPWWAGLAAYGVSRAIDNAFPGSPTGTMGNTFPGSGAGATGRTYTNRPTGTGGGVSANVRSPIGNMSFRSNPALLLAMAGLAYVLLK